MIVSINDVASLATLKVTPESPISDPSVITNGDYSQIYSDTLNGEVSIEFEFPIIRNVGYIALSGNFSSKQRIVIESVGNESIEYLYDSNGDQLVTSDGKLLAVRKVSPLDDSTLGLNESRVMVYRADLGLVSDIKITVYGEGQITINQIAIGDYYEIPGGEQSGYVRPWTVPNKEGRTITSLQNSPIALSYESRKISTSISLPNNIMANFDGWYNFIDFAVSNTFYVLEDDDKFHSCAGFNASPAATKAHSKTRMLGVSSIKFDAYSKESGVFNVI